MGFMCSMAGRGGRTSALGFNDILAAAFDKAPGICVLGFNGNVAGRGGRTAIVGFRKELAAAKVIIAGFPGCARLQAGF
jgi:hypothetical protein